MSSDLKCRDCGEAIQDDWIACPYCGRPAVDPDENESPNVFPNTAETRAEVAFVPPIVPDYKYPLAATKQLERDQSQVGFGLIALGVLGFLGGCGLLFSGSLTSLGSIETVVAVFLIGGGATVAAVVAGTVIISQRPSATGDGSSGILGGLLAGFMALGVCGLTVLAMIIYALESCLNGCQ